MAHDEMPQQDRLLARQAIVDTVEAVVARHMDALQRKRQQTMTIKIRGDTLPSFVGSSIQTNDYKSNDSDDDDDDEDDDDDDETSQGTDNILDTSIRKLFSNTTSGTHDL